MDWIAFLTEHRIPFVEAGPNTARNNVSIKCPWCGSSDESEHMGVSLEGRGFGCWRNAAHRGKNPAKLVQALLKCSWQEATQHAGQEAPAFLEPDEALPAAIRAKLGIPEPGEAEKPTQDAPDSLEWPPEIKPLSLATGFLARGAWEYLSERGYDGPDALAVASNYGLRFALSGPFRYRIVFPVVLGQNLVSWTGRTISPAVEVRYKTLSLDPEKAKADELPQALLPTSDTLWNFDEIAADNRAHTLILVEGPFDALRLDFYGRRHGARATCLFGKRLSVAQETLLGDIAHKFQRKIILLDPDAALDVLEIFTRLERMDFELQRLDSQWEDPAEMSAASVKKLISGDKKGKHLPIQKSSG